ncbi:MAG: hypothetical protein L0Z62_21270 [Gemmataceae bacterium]|nr:hypothetical protein [Gemmataceae bacterium]
MDALQELRDELERHKLDQGHLLGLFNVLIGRKITQADGSLVCAGLTWRELAAWLKKVRWEREAVKELGLDPEQLPPRDRQQFWYAAICRAQVDSTKATEAGDRLATRLRKLGYVVGPPPGKK